MRKRFADWMLVVFLLGLLGATIWFGYAAWTIDDGEDAPVSRHGYIAMALGIFFSLIVGFGLMALVFHSHRAGYDEPPKVDRHDRLD